MPDPTDHPRFPTGLVALLTLAMTGTLTLWVLGTTGALAPAVYWTGVVIFGLVFGILGWAVKVRIDTWTEARIAAGKNTWWDRIPPWLR